MIQLNELLHLVVIGTGIRVNHLFGCFIQIHIVTQIIKHHITVEHLRITRQALFCKTIIVIPRLHLSYHRLDISL